MFKSNRVWILVLALFVMLSFQNNAEAHESGYLGTGCYGGYPDTFYGFAWSDCIGDQYIDEWQQGSSGYWYRYVESEYDHYWWGIYQYSTWRTIGYCWYDSYCVQY